MGNTTDLSVRFKDYWDGFKPGEWQEGINTRDFIMTTSRLTQADRSSYAVLPSAQKRLTQSSVSFSKKSVKTAVYWI